MLNGIYRNPTAIFFGNDVEATLGEEVKRYSRRVLLHYGGSSFKRFGLYEKVTALLRNAGVAFCELGGVKPNPEAGLVYEGIDLCRREQIDFILAIGGGSVIDSAKAIGIGVPYNGDFFDFFEKRSFPRSSLRVGVVLTIPGAGSESGEGAVITHERLKKKYDCGSPVMYPVFSFLNPANTFTVSRYHTACGIVDAISHVLERYFTNTQYVEVSDGICEGLIKALMRYAVLVDKEPASYDIRAEIMWACKLAHDNTAGFGRKPDWASHKISHEIAVRNNATHGAILAVVFPAWMKYVYKNNKAIFLNFAKRVFEVDVDAMDADKAILLAIARYQGFLNAIGMPASLKELGFSGAEDFGDIARKCASVMPSNTIGNFVRLGVGDIECILKLCC